MESILKAEDTHRYMMLSRFQSDCEYYLGNGGRNAEHALWAKDEKRHIQNMKALHNSFDADAKPEWLTWEQILNYESQMVEMSVTASNQLDYNPFQSLKANINTDSLKAKIKALEELETDAHKKSILNALFTEVIHIAAVVEAETK